MDGVTVIMVEYKEVLVTPRGDAREMTSLVGVAFHERLCRKEGRTNTVCFNVVRWSMSRIEGGGLGEGDAVGWLVKWMQIGGFLILVT